MKKFQSGSPTPKDKDIITLGFQHQRDLGQKLPFEVRLKKLLEASCNEYMRGLSHTDQDRIVRLLLQLIWGGHEIISKALEHFEVEPISLEDFYSALVPTIGLTYILNREFHEIPDDHLKMYTQNLEALVSSLKKQLS